MPCPRTLPKASFRNSQALNMRYDEPYIQTYPFDKIVEGLLQPEMILETVEIVKGAIEKGVLVDLIINNRAGGNAPLIAREIAEKLIPKPPPKVKRQLRLW